MSIREWIINEIFLPYLEKRKTGGFMRETKNWFKSQTIICGTIIILVNLYQVAQPLILSQFGIELPNINPLFYKICDIIFGVGVIHGRITANTGITK